MKVQKTVDMGTADDVIQDGENAAIVYDIDEDSIAVHAKGIALLQTEGIELSDGKHAVTSIEIPPSFTKAQKALQDAGATVSHAKAECIIETKTGKLSMPKDHGMAKKKPAAKKAAPSSSEDSPAPELSTGSGHAGPMRDELDAAPMHEAMTSNAMHFTLFGLAFVAGLYFY